jgi:predicted HicB family RNase H-like nuclease
MITRSITFWDEVNDQLVEEAAKRLVSVNWLVNQLLKEGLERLQPEIKVTS